jgi:hypothetical protein
MKGRTAYNKPKNRNPEIYRLLVQIGGEARWKTLKTHLEELQLGPTTLKQALDELVEEESITKEARLGTEGAEVWYKVKCPMDNVWNDFMDNIGKPDAPLPVLENIKKNASKLEGKEKYEYLLEQMKKAIKFATEQYVVLLSLYVRSAQCIDTAILDKKFDYLWSTLLLSDTRTFQKILAVYPTPSLEAINDFIFKNKAKTEKAMEAEKEILNAMMAAKAKFRSAKHN